MEASKLNRCGIAGKMIESWKCGEDDCVDEEENGED